jgi:hypothetical protein
MEGGVCGGRELTPYALATQTQVVMGKTRAKQHYINDNARRKAMGILLHGDAAFAGQVGECRRLGDGHVSRSRSRHSSAPHEPSPSPLTCQTKVATCDVVQRGGT